MAKIAKIQLPDGRVAKFEVPDDASPEQAVQMANQHLAKMGIKTGQSAVYGGTYTEEPTPAAEPPAKVDPLDLEAHALAKQREPYGITALAHQGGMLGLGDEVAGVVGGIGNMISAPFSSKVDFDPVHAYQLGNRVEDVLLQDARDRTGATGTLAEIIGGFASGGGSQSARVAETLRGRMAQGATAGATGGAIAGFGYGEGANTPASTGVGALLGTGVGAAIPVIGQVVGNRVNAAQRFLGRDEELPRRVVAEAIQADANNPATLGQLMTDAQRRGSPVMLADSGENARGLLASVSRQPGPARAQVRQQVTARQEGQADRITAAIERDLGPVANVHEVRDGLMAQARENARPLYEQFEAYPGASSVNLDDLLNRPAFKAAMKKAYNLAAEDGVDPHSLGFDFNEAGDVVLTQVPSWRTLAKIKEGLDDVIFEGNTNPLTGAPKPTNENNAVNATRRTLLARMDAINPHYAAARRAWGGPVSGIEAMDKGLKALRLNADDIGAQTRNMGDMELNMYRLGVRRAMVDMVSGKGDYANKVTALLGSPKKRAALARLFRDAGDLDNFAATLGDEQAAQETFNSVARGSQTAERTAQDVQTDDAGLIERTADSAIRGARNGSVFGGLVADAIQALRDVGRFGPGTAGERARERVAALLSETDPAVIRELTQAARRAQQNLAGSSRRAINRGYTGGRLTGMGVGSLTAQPVE